MSVHDWTSHWFEDSPAAPPVAGAPYGVADLAPVSLDYDEAGFGAGSVVIAFPPRIGLDRAAQAPAPVEAGEVAQIADDLAAISRVLLDVRDENLPPTVSPTAGPTQGSVGASGPAQFELEPEPVVDVEEFRWTAPPAAAYEEVGTTVLPGLPVPAVEPVAAVVDWSALPGSLDPEVDEPVAAVVDWSALPGSLDGEVDEPVAAVVDWGALPVAVEPEAVAPSRSESAAALLRELAFLD